MQWDACFCSWMMKNAKVVGGDGRWGAGGVDAVHVWIGIWIERTEVEVEDVLELLLSLHSGPWGREPFYSLSRLFLSCVADEHQSAIAASFRDSVSQSGSARKDGTPGPAAFHNLGTLSSRTGVHRRPPGPAPIRRVWGRIHNSIQMCALSCLQLCIHLDTYLLPPIHPHFTNHPP